ncbi:hypothetical protein UPYG_G00158400 [Umbra pygmaea]|uniref:Uncharacterized protein n=1 Tax=Umbra pygmaea TaxID=75934 RepID=A0ABD0XES7_UMBPY
MKHFLLTICLMGYCSYVLAILPAPVNIFVKSLNFRNVLHWSPGPGTPSGTTYKIFVRKNSGQLALINETHSTSQILILKHLDERHKIVVQASHKNELSAFTNTTFSPYEDTIIGSPVFSLSGCGNCLDINISLDETVEKVFGHSISFDIQWKRADEATVSSTNTPNASYRLSNLKVGIKYCVNVTTKIVTNSKTQPSGWQCAFTSDPVPNTVPGYVAGAAVLLIVCGIFLMFVVFGLSYSGFLCKLKNDLPEILSAVIQGDFFFTPVRTSIDQISILSATKVLKTRNQNRDNSIHLSDGEEDEDEEEGHNGYMHNPMALSSDSSSSATRPPCTSGTNAAVHSGGSSVKVAVEEEEQAPACVVVVFGSRGQQEVKCGQVNVISSLDKEEEELEEDVEMSGNINLFSVTLGALQTRGEGKKKEEEGEDEEKTDLLQTNCTQKHSLYTERQTGNNTQTHSGYADRHTDSSIEKPSGYMVTHSGTELTDSEAEDEQFSGYMGR